MNEEQVKDQYKLGKVWKHLTLFLSGWMGLSVVATIISVIVASTMSEVPTDAEKIGASVLINFLSYFSIGAILIIISFKDVFKGIVDSFKNKSALLDGIAYGFLLMGASSALSIILNAIRGDSSVNTNESAIRLMTEAYPIPLFIMTAFFAPIVEELAYRMGLFNILARDDGLLAKSKLPKKFIPYVVYSISALCFALIHFDFTATGSDLINELWNLPSYILSGCILCRAYEKHRSISTSMIAHAINNGVAILSTILLS